MYPSFTEAWLDLALGRLVHDGVLDRQVCPRVRLLQPGNVELHHLPTVPPQS